jgi:hypothetical protein
MPTQFTFDVDKFRTMFPAFADETKFPDAALQEFWNLAICYISDKNYGYLNNDCRFNAINLMTAHLTALSVLISAGKTPFLAQSSTINKVSVTLTPPKLSDQWSWWLSTTPYGAQLLALLQAKSVGGWYVGGSADLAAMGHVKFWC